MNKNRTALGVTALAICGVAVIGAGVIFASRLLDDHMTRRAIEQDTFDDSFADTGYERGTLDLYDNYFNYYHKFENYLIMGTDHSGDMTAEGEDYHNPMADYLLLMSIDMTDQSYSLLELNRETMMDVPMITNDGRDGGTAFEQLCTAHWYGGTPQMGCQNQVNAVSKLLGDLPIMGYYAISMDDIAALNSAFGGVTVTLDQDLSKDDPAMKKGATLTLTDEQADIFLRSRMSLGDENNENRMKRQRQYLDSFLSGGMSKLTQEPKYFFNVFDSLESIAVSDLTGKQISKIADALTSKTGNGIVSFEGVSKLGKALPDGLEHAEFYPDRYNVVSTMTDLFKLKTENGDDINLDELTLEEESESTSETELLGETVTG